MATRLSWLASLTLVGAVVPFLEWANRLVDERTIRPDWGRLRMAAVTLLVVVSAILAVAAPPDTTRLAANQDLVTIERGLTGPRNAQ